MLALYIVLIEIFDLFAVYFGKMYSITDKWFYVALCSIAWGVSGIFFCVSLKYEGAAIVNILWISVSTIAATSLGVLYFKEDISGFQYVAMGVILLGIVLLFVKSPVSA